ncbi:MAG TPA: GIY-YIG nuclease family protein [Sphingomonadaceae bacterium]|nr:GIY-YIG nuclease family protein [Sphingomonadaceae bacterium]
MERPGYVYIMASRRNGTLYLGVTSNLIKRAYEHRSGAVVGFTRTHGCKLLVWYEVHASIDDARLRELRMKSWRRGWKMKLVDAMNPEWGDLYPSLF